MCRYDGGVLDSLLVLLVGLLLGHPAPGGQGDVDVQDGHDDDRQVERRDRRAERHRRVRQELSRGQTGSDDQHVNEVEQYANENQET